MYKYLTYNEVESTISLYRNIPTNFYVSLNSFFLKKRHFYIFYFTDDDLGSRFPNVINYLAQISLSVALFWSICVFNSKWSAYHDAE